MLRLISTQDNVPFKLEGDKLLTDAMTMNVRYIQDLSDPVRMDPLFVRALYLKLAMDVAPSLAKPSLVPQLFEEYQAAVELAIQKGAAQRNLNTDETPTSTWAKRLVTDGADETFRVAEDI
jgi:hypothetical protein